MYSKLSLHECLEQTAFRLKELREQIAINNDPFRAKSYEQMAEVNERIIVSLASICNEPTQKYLH